MTSKLPAHYKRLREVFGESVRRIGIFAYLCKQILNYKLNSITEI